MMPRSNKMVSSTGACRELVCIVFFMFTCFSGMVSPHVKHAAAEPAPALDKKSSEQNSPLLDIVFKPAAKNEYLKVKNTSEGIEVTFKYEMLNKGGAAAKAISDPMIIFGTDSDMPKVLSHKLVLPTYEKTELAPGETQAASFKMIFNTTDNPTLFNDLVNNVFIFLLRMEWTYSHGHTQKEIKTNLLADIRMNQAEVLQKKIK